MLCRRCTRYLSAPHNGPFLVSRQLYLTPSERQKSNAFTISKLSSYHRLFHATARKQAGPIFPILASLLKASYSLEFIRTAGRVVLTLVPFLSVNKFRIKKRLIHAYESGNPALAEKNGMLLHRMRVLTRLNKILIAVPVLLVAATVVASLERTPLTGRWRAILLSPEEEDIIAKQLAGPGWFQAVSDILTQEEPQPRIVPVTDWRYQWVEATMRRLEATIPLLSVEHHLEPSWLEKSDDIPFPPPATWPLQPRPRVTEHLKSLCKMLCERKTHTGPHIIAGPPYSLLIVERPDAVNAFSYGFGPDGGGGIVVYSGFLDKVLSSDLVTLNPEESSNANEPWFSWLFGAWIRHPPSPETVHPTPTPEQTSELAVLLAHELAHLVLSHHLESMSSSSIIIPSLLSIMTDIVRVVLFPLTMLLGPFVNDAVAQMGNVGGTELVEISEWCTNKKQEIEADVVSVRLLAHAGFNARLAVDFWKERSNAPEMTTCLPTPSENKDATVDKRMRRITGEYHPDSSYRVQRLEEELARWAAEKRSALTRRLSST